MCKKFFSSNDPFVQIIGEGGNSKVYLCDRPHKGYNSFVIKVPKIGIRTVEASIDNYYLIRKHGIKTTDFLEQAVMDGMPALVTQNLHEADYTCLDSNAHLKNPEYEFLQKYCKECGLSSRDWVEPREEKDFSKKKIREITNIADFVRNHIAFLAKVSLKGIYLAYDAYFYRVRRAAVTDIDYIIADWDDAIACNTPDLYKLNVEGFKESMKKFCELYVDDASKDDYMTIVNWA